MVNVGTCATYMDGIGDYMKSMFHVRALLGRSFSLDLLDFAQSNKEQSCRWWTWLGFGSFFGQRSPSRSVFFFVVVMFLKYYVSTTHRIHVWYFCLLLP